MQICLIFQLITGASYKRPFSHDDDDYNYDDADDIDDGDNRNDFDNDDLQYDYDADDWLPRHLLSSC